MNDKQSIELGTAEGFLALYNRADKADYQIEAISDAPDIRCLDSHGNALNLEITLTEDRLGDIQAMVGRSSVRSFTNFNPSNAASALNGNVFNIIIQRIAKKSNKDYGDNVALVIRDTSGVDWDWNLVIGNLRDRLASMRNPYDRGIWIINRTRDRLFRVL